MITPPDVSDDPPDGAEPPTGPDGREPEDAREVPFDLEVDDTGFDDPDVDDAEVGESEAGEPDAGEPDAERSGIASWLGTVEGLITVVVVLGAALFVFAQFQPDLIFSKTTPAGGDMGAHVWSPAYLRDHLLTKGRLSGWTPDWYAGFPAMQFYMVLPMLLIVGLSYVVPYGIAFKLVTVSGVVSLPLSAYAFGRLTRQRFPIPALLAVAGAVFVFDRSFSIYGGNAASTLAGEFAFAMSLSLAVLYLGVVGRGLAEGGYRALAALLLALTALCHLIPTFFALAGTAVWFALYLGRDLYECAGSLDDDRFRSLWAATRARVWWLLSSGPVAGLLAAFWVLPFYLKSQYLNDMGWEKKTEYGDLLFWRQDLGTGGLVDYPTLALVLALALAGLAMSLALRNRGGLFLAGLAFVAAVGFRFVPQGRLWNTRLLPFYYLALLLLAAVAIGLVPQLLRAERARRWVGGITLGATVLLQLGLSVTPESPIGAIGWDRPQWKAYVYVGLGLATLIAGAELLTMPTHRRHVIAWGLVGFAAFFQVLMVLDSSSRTGTRLLGWTACLLGLVSVSALAELADARRRAPGWLPGIGRAVATLGVVAAVFVYLALPLRSLGALGEMERTIDGTPTGAYSLDLLGWELFTTRDDSFVDGWASWNYRGYESTCDGPEGNPCARGRKNYFPEYEAIVHTMQQVGEEHGCGRAMWEYSGELDRYGTPMALMLLPHWTDGCIGSMEGLYFEASTTTPYHFINQDELSTAGSNAQRGLPYAPGAPSREDFDLGIRHLQMLGVRYYLSYTPEMTELAREHGSLTELTTSPAVCRDDLCPEGVDPPDRWVVFEVADSELVAPLAYEPVVLTGIGKGHTCDSVDIADDPRGRECKGWLDPAVEWYMDDALWDVPFAASGPDEWERIPVETWLEDHEAPSRPLDPVVVSDISSDDDEISFTVDQVGVPVVVRASYFPNWKVEGAEGPYRIAPNLMVVIPTDEEVRLHYGWVPIDLFSWLLTFVGIGCLVLLIRRPALTIPPGPVAVWHRAPRGAGEAALDEDDADPGSPRAPPDEPTFDVPGVDEPTFDEPGVAEAPPDDWAPDGDSTAPVRPPVAGTEPDG